jgi:hypothetical protein
MVRSDLMPGNAWTGLVDECLEVTLLVTGVRF